MPDGLGLFYVIVKTLFPPQDATEIDALLAEWEVTRALPRLADRPLLLWHGDADDVVPRRNLPSPAGTTARRAGRQPDLPVGSGVRHRITPAALDATVDFSDRIFKRAEF